MTLQEQAVTNLGYKRLGVCLWENEEGIRIDLFHPDKCASEGDNLVCLWHAIDVMFYECEAKPVIHTQVIFPEIFDIAKEAIRIAAEYNRLANEMQPE